MMDEDVTFLYGAKKASRTESPLHAEAEGLIWVMHETLKRDPKIMHFEIDYQHLVKLVKNVEEKWPAMATELDEINAFARNFSAFSVSYVSGSLNLRADGLTKGIRSRELWIPYVNCYAPRWLVHVASQMDAN